MKKIIFGLLPLLCLSANKIIAQPGDKRFAGLDTTFNRILKDWKAVGFAVAVVEKNKIVYSRGAGFRDLEKKLPVTPNTLFAIGSCTKAFTSSLIGLLQKDGLIDYDKPVRDYLPELKFFNDAVFFYLITYRGVGAFHHIVYRKVRAGHSNAGKNFLFYKVLPFLVK